MNKRIIGTLVAAGIALGIAIATAASASAKIQIIGT